MSALLAPTPVMRFYDNNNNPLAGGQLYTYQAGTTTPAATFTDSTGSTQNPNPVVMNARGEASVWFSPTQAYKLVLKDASANTIWTVDQVTSPAPVAVGNMTDEKGSNGQPGFSAANGDFIPGTTTSLTLSTNYGSASNLWVAFDAAEQGADTLSLSGETLTFSAPIPVGTNKVYVKGGTALTASTPGNGTVVDATVAPNAAINSSKLLFSPGWTGAVSRSVQAKLADVVNVMDFGAVGDGTHADETAFQAAINYLEANANPNGGACGTLIAPAGKQFTFKNAGITINTPIKIDCQSIISYVPTTGTAVKIGTVAGWSNAYDIYFAGFTSSASGAFPPSINASGNTAVQISSMTFSRFTVRTITGFSNIGVYLDGTGGLGFQQVVQHNRMDLGQIANCGLGLKLLSTSAATSSAEANRIFIQNVYENFTNIQVDNASFYASTSNTFDINAMDDCSSDGLGLDMYGAFNQVYIGYTGCSVRLNSNSANNRVYIENTFGSGAVVAYGGTNNWVQTGTGDSSQVPKSGIAVALNTVYENTVGVPVMVTFSANLTSTSGSSETATVSIGATSSSLLSGPSAAVGASTPALTIQFPFTFIVPPGYSWEVTSSGSGAIALSTATIIQIG